MAIKLRCAQADDYQAVNALATGLVGFDADRRKSYRRVLASPDHQLMVAEVSGRVVGFAHLLLYEDLSHGALAGELLGLVVGPDLRRQGIGEALLRDVCRVAAERGVGELHVNTEPANEAAQSLYRKLGLELVGVQMELDLGGPRR